MTAYLASYRGKGRGLARMTGALIRWVTRSEWSHCEIARREPDGLFSCLSASGMDGGVRVKRMELHPDRWHLTPLPWVPHEQMDRAAEMAEGKGYDWAGVLRFGLPLVIRRDHPRRWFCSELCAAVIGLPDPWRWTPADLFILTEALVIEQDPAPPRETPV